jgi:glutaconate CoA-transferase, subunit B
VSAGQTAVVADAPFTADEMMTICAARALRDGMTCFVGIGLPSAAANLARATHAPDLVLIYESGTIGAKPGWLPLSIGDGVLAQTADAVVSVPEIFNYWLQPGRIDIGFLGAAQIDRFGNINTTVIGSAYHDPKIRLPGAGGAPEIAASCREVIIVVRQSRRSFVDRVDFVTSVGYGDGAGHRELLGLRGAGPRKVITDLGVLEPDPVTRELTMTGVFPGITAEQARERTGWDLTVPPHLEVLPPPSPDELTALRALQAITPGSEGAGARGSEGARLWLSTHRTPPRASACLSTSARPGSTRRSTSPGTAPPRCGHPGSRSSCCRTGSPRSPGRCWGPSGSSPPTPT